MANDRFDVQHRGDESRYVLLDASSEVDAPTVIGEEQYVDVVDGDDTERVMFHTVVSSEYGGQGLASLLVRHAVEHSIAEGAIVVPVCPFVAKWFEKHTEYASHVTAPTTKHLEAIQSNE